MSFTCAYTEAVSPLKAISRVVTCVPAPFCPAGRTLMRSTQFSSAQSVVATGTEPPRILSDLATPPFVLESSISAAFCSGWVLRSANARRLLGCQHCKALSGPLLRNNVTT